MRGRRASGNSPYRRRSSQYPVVTSPLYRAGAPCPEGSTSSDHHRWQGGAANTPRRALWTEISPARRPLVACRSTLRRGCLLGDRLPTRTHRPATSRDEVRPGQAMRGQVDRHLHVEVDPENTGLGVTRPLAEGQLGVHRSTPTLGLGRRVEASPVSSAQPYHIVFDSSECAKSPSWRQRCAGSRSGSSPCL